mgnify:CR=1 FL=1
MDYRRFFERKAEEVAKDLLGRILIRTTRIGSTSATIIETGAYEGGKEIKARKGMEYEPGRLFLMPCRGNLLFNIATDREIYPSCVELRKVGTHEKTVTGSGAITRFFDIPKYLDGVLLGGEIQIIGESLEKSKIKKIKSDIKNCLGIYSIGED